MTASDTPAVRLINLEDQLSKYKFDDAITADTLAAFLNLYNEGKLKASAWLRVAPLILRAEAPQLAARARGLGCPARQGGDWR